ncbi:response regulator transcription factor [Paenibacillus sp.]|uniref:response regulator transcription factor n=1 Tax=Paenibacillus sp. TaxID=58172 RepID=UPI002D729638|nr:response regulator [Paenibacillus sp.]HZG86302.1 response regulator [Paenibacillus sp.]
MIRVLLADDEPLIRYGIKASVDWEREGFRLVADVANGADALAVMETETIDILITDIKMPIMDGLALTKKAMALHPGIKVVFVSSYNDFEYVREGLRLGVVDYILKPSLEPEDLLQIVKKCAEAIRAEGRVPRDAAEDDLRERRGYEHTLKRFLVHRSQAAPAGRFPPWLDGAYTAAYAALHRQGEADGFLNKSIVADSFVDLFYAENPRGIVFPTSESEMFCLLPFEEAPERRFGKLRDAMRSENGTDVSFGCVASRGTDDLQRAYDCSKQACRRSFFRGAGIYRFEEADPSIRDASGEDLPRMLESIPDPNGEALAEAVGRWRARWTAGGKPPDALKEEACRVLSQRFKHAIDPYALVECFDLLFASETFDELCRRLLEQIAELSKIGPELAAPQNPVGKALEYIRRHYLETITLQQVADYVHVSKNYFSILFKKTMGCNFIDYLIDLRIQKAKELLLRTDLKIYEIAEQSGFNDTKYFSKLFKKVIGLSPNEFRECHGMVPLERQKERP